ncbi:hypothetical protein pb186bvf_020552 [Paramecium bursaria]
MVSMIFISVIQINNLQSIILQISFPNEMNLTIHHLLYKNDMMYSIFIREIDMFAIRLKLTNQQFYNDVGSQGINLASQDLQDSNWAIVGWTAQKSDGTSTNNYGTSSKCNNQNVMILDSNYFTYSKSYTISDYEFSIIYLELELYFYRFTETQLILQINGESIYKQTFKNLMLSNVCGSGQDSQYIIFQGFYIKSQTINIQIQYINSNLFSFVGIRNLNIYSNGTPLIGGCPMSAPYNQGGVCSTSCLTKNQLEGPNVNICTSNLSGALIVQVLSSNQNVWMLNLDSSNIPANWQDYLTVSNSIYFLKNSQIYPNVMTNQLMSSLYPSSDVFIYYYPNINIVTLLQLQFGFVFYILGEWEDNSSVKIYIKGSGVLYNNMVVISKTDGQYYSSTQSGIYFTNLTQGQQQVVARKTLITFSGYFAKATVDFGFRQMLFGSNAAYGFGDMTFYKANFASKQELYRNFVSCSSRSQYAFNGTCRASCPPYSITSQTNGNCTELTITESGLFDKAITTNLYGTYLIKNFYDNNFQQSDITKIFIGKPPSYKNQLNGQHYSVLSGNKILGGFNSWGYGSYISQFTNLKPHIQVRIYFTLYLIDNLETNDNFSVFIDGVIAGTPIKQIKTSQLQGLSTSDYTTNIVYKVPHLLSTLQIIFQCNIAQKDASQASCGIKNLFVLLDQIVDTLCPLNDQYFSYFTQNCEICKTAPCILFPGKSILNKCNIGCKTCTSLACTLCDTSNGNELSQSTCVCSEGFVMQNSICFQCSYQCKTCSGPRQNQCLTCDQTRTLSNNQCICNSNYIDVISIKSCALITSTCHYSCQTCFGSQYYQCITCSTNIFRAYEQTSNNCNCISGYQDVGSAQCQSNSISCDERCIQCYQTGNSLCLGCSQANNRNNFDYNSDSCSCLAGYNDALNPGQTCVMNFNSCHYSCSACYGSESNNCLSCQSDYFRTFSKSQCLCNQGYLDITIHNCVVNYSPCQYSCLTCFGANYDQCLSCPSSRSLVIVTLRSQSSCKCDEGTFDNGGAICLLCDYTCKTCTAEGNLNCSSCDALKFRIKVGSQCQCIDNYNDVLNFEGSCTQNYTPCHYSCLTCYQDLKLNCLTCDNDRSLQDHNCICKDDHYEINKICVFISQVDLFNCHYSCQTCFGSMEDQCLTCQNNNSRWLSNNLCLCMQGYYENNSSLCLKCDYSCNTCEFQSTICLNCDTLQNRKLVNTNCICEDGYFDIKEPNCLKCQFSCHMCNQNQDCLCYDGYYSQGIQCGLCNRTCLTCDGRQQNNCLSCDQNQSRFLFNQQCICKQGYFNYGGKCLSCSLSEGKKYHECLYQNYQDLVWTSGEYCDDGNSIPRDGCTSFRIDSGYYCDNQSLIKSWCYQCPSNCLKCQQENQIVQCKSCQTNYFLQNNQCIQCQDQNCEICDSYSNCAKCQNGIQPTNGQCQFCQYGYHQDKNQCLPICGDGIKTLNEQCDDSNLLNGDGCDSYCQIEKGFICQADCTQIDKLIKAQLITIGHKINNIEIEIQSQIYDIQNIFIQIEQLAASDDFDYNLTQTNINNYEIQFRFYKPIHTYNIIHIYIPVNKNLRMMDQQITEIKLLPINFMYFNTIQTYHREIITIIQQRVYQILGYLGPICFILGCSNQYFNTMNLISWYNNLYYINLDLPTNLDAFLKYSTWESVFPSQFFQLQVEQNNQGSIPQRFEDKGIDGLAINSIQFLFPLIIILAIWISKVIINLHRQHQKRKIHCISHINNQQKVAIQANVLVKTIIMTLQMFYGNRFKIIYLMLNLFILNIFLAAAVNLKYQYYFKEFILVLCFISSLIILLLCLYFIICVHFVIYAHRLVSSKIQWFNDLRFSIFGVIKNNAYVKFYAFQSIFQKMLYINSIVIFYENPLFQILICAMIFSLQVNLIIMIIPQIGLKNLRLVINDISLFIIFISFIILAANKQAKYLNQNQEYNLGWFLIAIILLSLLIQILILIKNCLQRLLMISKQIAQYLK